MKNVMKALGAVDGKQVERDAEDISSMLQMPKDIVLDYLKKCGLNKELAVNHLL